MVISVVNHAQGKLKEPALESISFVLGPDPGRRPEQVVAEALGPGFRVRPLGKGGRVEAIPERALPAGTGWDLARRLRAQADVRSAEPLFAVPGDDARRRGSSGPGPAHDPAAAANPVWSLEDMRVFDAWALFPAGHVPGDGVRIAHPDTGFTRHPELAGARLRTDLGYDFVDEDSDAEDTLETDGFLPQPSHGTRTGSVMVSPPGSAPGSPKPVTGVAPGAELVPFRVSRSIVLWSMRNLARALHRAVDQGCHVVSISMGGVPSQTLAEAIRVAQDQGLIVVAAAGNEVPFVVWPARYPEVVAVAASNVRRQPWAHSSSGAAVDITAPGESVWRAETVRGATPYRVDMGSGTSFATAGVAGVAALWLSYHGRDALLARLATPGDLPRLFQAILRRAAVAPPGWDRGRYGPGIVDARRALEMSLEEAMADLTGPTVPATAHAGLEGLLGARARPRLARLLGVGARHLDDALAEVGDELLFRILTSRRVRESILAVAPAAARARVVRGGDAARALLARGASTALGRYLRPGSPSAAG